MWRYPFFLEILGKSDQLFCLTLKPLDLGKQDLFLKHLQPPL